MLASRRRWRRVWQRPWGSKPRRTCGRKTVDFRHMGQKPGRGFLGDAQRFGGTKPTGLRQLGQGSAPGAHQAAGSRRRAGLCQAGLCQALCAHGEAFPMAPWSVCQATTEKSTVGGLKIGTWCWLSCGRRRGSCWWPWLGSRLNGVTEALPCGDAAGSPRSGVPPVLPPP